jgi:hypothetical protein
MCRATGASHDGSGALFATVIRIYIDYIVRCIQSLLRRSSSIDEEDVPLAPADNHFLVDGRGLDPIVTASIKDSGGVGGGGARDGARERASTICGGGR